MPLITLLFLGTFTLLYISAAVPKKPPAMEKALAWIAANMKYLAIGGMVFGLIAAMVTPILVEHPTYMFIQLLANILIILMTLPYCFEGLVAKHTEKINTAVLEETRNIIGWVQRQDKIFGGIGAVTCILLFAFIFR